MIPLLKLLEEMELGDPTSDGGGDLETSTLCLASFVCLLEVHGSWRELKPYVLPIGLSSARRLNILMRSCFVLLSNRGEASGAGTQCWAHSGFALFACSIVPLLRVAAIQTPQAYRSLHGPLCRWYPPKTFQALLEALCSTPDIEREVRSCLFRKIQEAMRTFAWPCRFTLYLELITKCRIDAVVGEITTTFREDWWPLVLARAEKGEGIQEERSQLVEVLKVNLSGSIQITDGMDALTATLNLTRLVALARTPVGETLRASLRKGGSGVDLDGMLKGISEQIDYELGCLKQKEGQENPKGALADELLAQLASQGGQAQAADMRQMEQHRIEMVAHLVARVRELLSESSG